MGDPKETHHGFDDKEAVSLTMEQFPSLKEDQPHHDIHHASALKEFTQFITNSTQRSTNDSREQSPSDPHEVQGGHIKTSTDYPWRQLRTSNKQRKYFVLVNNC